MSKRRDNRNRVLRQGESQRNDGRYMYRYTDQFGLRRCLYDTDLSNLREKEKYVRRDYEDGIDSYVAKRRTLNEQFDLYIDSKAQLANSTRQKYLGLWETRVRNNKIGKSVIANLKRSDIIAFYNELEEEGLQRATIREYGNCLISPTLQMAVDDDLLRKNVCEGTLRDFRNDNAKKRNALSPGQQDAMLEFVKSSCWYRKRYPLLVFMLETGLRCGETIGLTWEDVDFENRCIRVDHQLIYKKYQGQYCFYASSPKTDAGIRTVPLTKQAYDALVEQKDLQKKLGNEGNVEIDGYSNFVFSTGHGNPIMPSAINSLLDNIVAAYNKKEGVEKLPHISAHVLRHTACTRMAERGMDPKVLQTIMGHASIEVTMEVYNHASEERNQKEVDRLDEVLLTPILHQLKLET